MKRYRQASMKSKLAKTRADLKRMSDAYVAENMRHNAESLRAEALARQVSNLEQRLFSIAHGCAEKDHSDPRLLRLTMQTVVDRDYANDRVLYEAVHQLTHSLKIRIDDSLASMVKGCAGAQNPDELSYALDQCMGARISSVGHGRWRFSSYIPGGEEIDIRAGSFQELLDTTRRVFVEKGVLK